MLTQVLLVQTAATLRALDLDSFIEAIDKAESVGAFMDPTRYRENLYAGDPLGAMRKIAVAARDMRGALPTACRKCGCTDDKACADGCSWVAPGLCSRCMPELVPA
jgi:hypothetical protein